jgi:hypothetical protein
MPLEIARRLPFDRVPAVPVHRQGRTNRYPEIAALAAKLRAQDRGQQSDCANRPAGCRSHLSVRHVRRRADRAHKKGIPFAPPTGIQSRTCSYSPTVDTGTLGQANGRKFTASAGADASFASQDRTGPAPADVPHDGIRGGISPGKAQGSDAVIAFGNTARAVIS